MRYNRTKRDRQREHANKRKIERSITEQIRYLIKNNRLEQAESLIEENYHKLYNNSYFMHELARYKSKTGGLEEAKTLYKEIINSDAPNKYYSMYELAKLYYLEGDLNNAYSYYSIIVNSDHPDKSFAYLELGKVCVDLNKRKEALYHFNMVAEMNLPNSYHGTLHIIDLISHTADFEKSLEAIEKIDISSGDKNCEFLVLVKKADYLTKLFRLEEAMECINKALKLNPTSKYDAILIRAKIKEAQGDFEGAIKDAKSIEFSSDNRVHDSKLFLAKLYCYIGEKEKGIEMFNLIKKESPEKSSFVTCELGQVYEFYGDYDQALKHYLEVEDVLSDFFYNVNSRLLNYYINNKEYDKAMKYIDKLDKNNHSVLTRRPKLYLNNFLENKYEVLPPYSYSESMLLNYDSSIAYLHILEHKDGSGGIHSVFNDEVDIQVLFDKYKDKVVPNGGSPFKFFQESFYKYENIGNLNECKADYLKVVTIPGTNNIISMYPATTYKSININEVDLDINTKKEEPVKIKRISQIDKFNARYGLK